MATRKKTHSVEEALAIIFADETEDSLESSFDEDSSSDDDEVNICFKHYYSSNENMHIISREI